MSEEKRIAGYDVPAQAIAEARFSIGQLVPSSVDGPELTEIVTAVLENALPLIAPASTRPGAGVAEQFAETFLSALPESYAKDPASTNYAFAAAFGIALQKIAGRDDVTLAINHHFHVPLGHMLSAVGDAVRIEPVDQQEGPAVLAMLQLSGELGGKAPTETCLGYLRRLLDFVTVREGGES